MKAKITEGFGYYRLDRFPLGGDFRRAPKGGIEIVADEKGEFIVRSYDGFIHGCNCEVRLADGSKAAVNNAHLELVQQ